MAVANVALLLSCLRLACVDGLEIRWALTSENLSLVGY